KQSEDLQKKYGIGSQLLKQSEDLQRKYGIGNQLLKQSEDLQKKYGIGSQLLKQSENLQKKYGIGSQLLKQSMDLQRKYGIGSQLLKQAEEFQRKLGIGRTLQKEFDLMHNLAGINSIQSMLQDLQNHSLTRSNKDILNTFDNTFLHFAEENLPSVSEAIETGLASVAKAYTDGVAQSTNQTNVQSGQATSTDINYSPATNAPRSLIDLLQGLPPSIQALILFLLYQVLIGAVADYGKGKVLVEINKAESYIVSLFESKPVTKSNIVKHNKNIAWDSLNQFRVITGENVRLRTKPSLNSDIIETIGKNTIVAILEKKERQWLYVQVQSGDELVTGWITRTYTKPLKG
ncbi:hypothetical protein DBY68_016620, partial [Pseudocitrobacter sp. RIT415]|uniref:SH3 domain-containing protein n=1 Tax=Pseudocitrobacter sp. RIT415 TaxID=2202163 RepID=UPI000DCE1415